MGPLEEEIKGLRKVARSIIFRLNGAIRLLIFRGEKIFVSFLARKKFSLKWTIAICQAKKGKNWRNLKRISFDMEKIHETKKAAFAELCKKPLSCVFWMEGQVKMSAIYWNGKRRIQKADAKIN